MNLNQITVPAINVQETVTFYQTLGLELIVDALPKYARLLCPDGNATLSVHKVDHLTGQPGIIIYFECEQLDEVVNELIGKGIHFDQLPKDESWLWREAILNDPAGNKIKLYFAGENRVYPPWRVGET